MNSSTWNNKMERHANIIHISETNVFAMEKCMTSWCLGHAKITDALMHQDLTKWQYPPHNFINFIKCNIDVSFSTDHNWVEIGVCLCGEFGMLMGAKTLWLQQILRWTWRSLGHFSINGEGLGISFRASSVLLRLKVVDSFNSGVRDDTKLGSILTSCRALLLFLCNNSYRVFKRDTNKVAHNHAKAYGKMK
jgi:hypothetical protein